MTNNLKDSSARAEPAVDELSMPMSEFMAGWQVYKAKDIEPYCDDLRKSNSLLRRELAEARRAESRETLDVLDSVIETMDKLARKNFPQLGITDARYDACFKAILLRNKLKGSSVGGKP